MASLTPGIFSNSAMSRGSFRAATLPVTPTRTQNFFCGTDELFPAGIPGSGREMGSMLQSNCAGTAEQRHWTHAASKHSRAPTPTYSRGHGCEPGLCRTQNHPEHSSHKDFKHQQNFKGSFMFNYIFLLGYWKTDS